MAPLRPGHLTAASARGIDRGRKWKARFRAQPPPLHFLMALSLPARLPRIAETLLTAAAGGFLFDRIGFPAGWLAGAMMFTAAAALAGRPIGRADAALPRLLHHRRHFHRRRGDARKRCAAFGTWPLSILAVVDRDGRRYGMRPAPICARVHGWELLSRRCSPAFRAACPRWSRSPPRRSADLRAIAIVQTVRVVILAVGIPAGARTVRPHRTGPDRRRHEWGSPRRPANWWCWWCSRSRSRSACCGSAFRAG